MKRYSFGYKCYTGESGDGEWCKADEAQAEIDELKAENYTKETEIIILQKELDKHKQEKEIETS